MRRSRNASRATDREVRVVEAVLVAGSEKAAAHQLGLSHSTVKHHLAMARSKVGATTTAQLVWILAPRLPEPDPATAACPRGASPRSPTADDPTPGLVGCPPAFAGAAEASERGPEERPTACVEERVGEAIADGREQDRPME